MATVRTAASALLAVLMLASGCAPHPPARQPRDSQSAEGTPGRASVSGRSLPATISLETTAAPSLAFREYRLPSGCEITDHTGRIGVYSQNTWRANAPTLLGLLDLGTGRHRIVVRRAVNRARGFAVFAPRLSDSWLAWEEVSPNEAAEPRNATWRLYAAPVRAGLALGPPRLVDEGHTSYKLRPHYAVLGSSAFWSVNTVPSAQQESVTRSGSIEALDLTTGARRTLLRSPRSFPTLNASGTRLTVTETTGESDAPYSVRVHVLDPVTDRAEHARDLDNANLVSHFVEAGSDWLAWATFAQSGAEWPNLYLASLPAARRNSRTLLAGIDSIDPAFFGRYVAFESVESSFGGSAGGVLRRTRSIWVADPTQRTRARLLETRDSEGWWQTCAGSTQSDLLVLSNDLGAWAEDPSQAVTLVRVYTAAR